MSRGSVGRSSLQSPHREDSILWERAQELEGGADGRVRCTLERDRCVVSFSTGTACSGNIIRGPCSQKVVVEGLFVVVEDGLGVVGSEGVEVLEQVGVEGLRLPRKKLRSRSISDL